MSAFASVVDILNLILKHGQNPLVYPAAFDSPEMRRPRTIQTPAGYGMPYLAPLLKTSDGVDLSCYLIPQTRNSLANSYEVPQEPVVDERVELTPAASEAQATIIVFHGNSMHNWEDMYSARYLYKMKCNVLLLSYRGYSFSGGSPTESGLQVDAQTALHYILGEPHLAQVPIILYGHSLGGGVAIDLASRNPSYISAIVVSNTFTSVPDIVRAWPLIGAFSFVCTQKWRSVDKLRHIPKDTPMLMISGRQDEVIPAQLMDRLWQAARKRGVPAKSTFHWPSAPCAAKDDSEPPAEMLPEHDVFVSLEQGTHNSTPNFPEYWKAISRFVEAVGQRIKEEPHISPAAAVHKMPDRRWRHQEGNVVVV
ncbi:hypothetical protein DXG01_012073 [Tephrocybe rancida]|nr:hypothetical protein DXG01_012073 [Tephrocybe rancida]